MSDKSIRVRFAPSPTGFMHLGNVRAALMNYLFAKHYHGTFLLRIEDTDTQRNVDPQGKNIISDLKWLGLNYDEGPGKPGNFGPYYQSQRQSFYKQYLDIFIDQNLVYKCFCSSEKLETKRKLQLTKNLPPRYDRECLELSKENIEQNTANNVPYIWRYKLNYDDSVSFYDIAHKQMRFELKHFSDIPLTRQDGSFTFIFANFVDDHKMEITHVLRGEDHLTNTAIQVALYNAINAKAPIFWHLPILINKDGKKLSKRDFGFSLNDLRQSGYLPEAITNYLGIIGVSFSQEIMDLIQLSQEYNFQNISPTGHIKYDIDKLNWVNQQWIMRYPIEKLTELVMPYLKECYLNNLSDNALDISEYKLKLLIETIKPELITLENSCELLKFYFKQPELNIEDLSDLEVDKYIEIFRELIQSYETISDNAKALEKLKSIIKNKEIKTKPIFMLTRLALTGKTSGLSIDDLFKILSPNQIKTRLSKLVS